MRRSTTTERELDDAQVDDDLRALLRRVRQVELRARRAVNASAMGAWHSRFKGRGMAFAESRAYVAGDDPRHVDWLATARQGDLFVKQFVEERELTLLLAVDLSASMNTGSRGRTRRQAAAEAAAVLSFSALRNQDKIGLVAFTDRIERLVRPTKGRGHVLRVIRDVLGHRAIGMRTDLAVACEAATHVASHRAIVALISDLVGAPLPEDKLKVLARRHDVVVIEIEEPLDTQLPAVGLVSVVDPETGDEVLIDTDDARVRQHFADDATRARSATRATLDRLGIERVVIQPGGQESLLPLLRFLRRRARRAA